MQAKIEAAKEAFGKLLTEQLARVEEMKKQGDFVDYKSLDQITSVYAAVTVSARQLPVRHRELWSTY